ncbi:MAG: o-succinylbenzoate synthase [Thermosynechococcaceae cyanobacterium MS004]|nr:o-succinylbenzoate synthase [Thermosynechococcaceae cyanobacterium MS004]
MTYRLHLQPYQRRFRQPLQTHHGQWSVREGLLVGLQQGDAIGWGEIAPLPWFGTETVEEAIAFCDQLSPVLTEQAILEIPDALPACQFGFGSAWESLTQPSAPAAIVAKDLSGLLPAGDAARSTWQILWQNGHRTFKWKIGVADLDHELQIFQGLAQELPPEAHLRLDANGGLTLTQAQRWLECCDRLSRITLEYLEQPLPPEQIEIMQQLGCQFKTPIALDESVATLPQLIHCHAQGWQGIMVVKPAIAGYPQALRDFLQNHAVNVAFSSVFETEVGRNAAIKLAQDCSTSRAMGFGTEHWFLKEYPVETAHVLAAPIS